MEQTFEHLMDYPHENGFLMFTIGILFILSVYHVLLYFQNKDKLYLIYGIYAFFCIMSQLIHLKQGFLLELIKPLGKIPYYSELYAEATYIAYFFFAFRFLEAHKQFPKWTSICFKVIYMLCAVCIGTFGVFLFTKEYQVVNDVYYYFTLAMFLVSIISFVLFFKVKHKLKYYIIGGGLIIFLFSFGSLLYYLELRESGQSIQKAYSILYIGFILENIIFSLGLGHKQKLILEDRNESKNKLINQLKENEVLRKKVQKQLEQDVKALNKQAEIERLESIKMKYDKEMAELKVSALRSQMNPHFIFNSLNSIKRYIIDNEKENAVFYMNKFSKLIRKILNSTMEKESTLLEELETMQLYISIENIRFNNTIDFKLHVDETLNTTSIKLPSLITQPFIENAIWHGLSLKKTNKKLTIDVQKPNKDQIQIDIIDNGIGRKKATDIKKKKLLKRKSVGISLSEERLKHFSENYKSTFNVTFTDLYKDGISAGTKVTLLIPLT